MKMFHHYDIVKNSGNPIDYREWWLCFLSGFPFSEELWQEN
ncbi:hypothetical protein [Cruoricaptor ignavus]|nr:hypothetical protein [Cruoricaptor ignavus]